MRLVTGACAEPVHRSLRGRKGNFECSMEKTGKFHGKNWENSRRFSEIIAL
jgi:hypothetical protein